MQTTEVTGLGKSPIMTYAYVIYAYATVVILLHLKNTVLWLKKIKDNVILMADRKDDLYYLWGCDNTNFRANCSSESIDSTINKYADVQNGTVEWIT